MELNEQGFLEELLSLRRETWEGLPATGMNEFLANGWSLDCFNENPGMVGPDSSSCGGFTMSKVPSLDEVYYPFGDEFSQLLPDMDSSSCEKRGYGTLPFPNSQKECPSPLMEEEEPSETLWKKLRNLEELHETSCKVEPVQATDVPVFNMGLCLERKNRAKKVEGQPSKNLMAERRRRKRLNDRLSMLRSVVPKISKVSINPLLLLSVSTFSVFFPLSLSVSCYNEQQMDRTSILGDTIDYMKELLGRIKSLQGENEEGSDQSNLVDTFKELKPNEVLVRNTPKFDVQRRNIDTTVEICCAGKPGLLLSTVTTLEALGLEIEQCVISCFNDFAMHASCSEEMEQRAIISSEDIKQTLFRSAGYGGRCL
ncbi:transcription factor bHLH93-like isoform X1 [Telopea speciosissima]|uniref:transcription factor bHLH93-like isoform X1 n=1 Tax=Telopea speciosissima TaxID=54955 RepID=UPI001CC5CD3A|nr:transcription factor bHLH93-like isoform X1 [Telopea speciosissima]